jgi:hypothetical protein
MAQTKPKYRLLNKWGNRVEYTNSEVEKNILLDRGFHIDTEWGQTTEEKKPTAKKRKAVNKNDRNVED